MLYDRVNILRLKAPSICSIDGFKIISFILLSLSIIGLFLPLLFIVELPDYVKQSTLADTVRSEDTLTVAYLCSMCTCMPLMLDIILDVFSNIKNLNYKNRLQLLLMVIIPGVIFIQHHSDGMFPFIFIDLIFAQFSVMIHMTVSHMVEFAPQQLLSTSIFYLGLISFYLSNNLQSISMLLSSSSTSIAVDILSLVLFCISLLVLLFITYKWLRYVYELHDHGGSVNYMPDSKQDNDFYLISSYLSVLWFSVIAYFVANSINLFKDLQKFNEISCLVYIVHITVIVAILSVLPS